VRRHGTISPFIHTHTILCLKIKGSLSYCSPSPFSASRVSTHHPSPARARHRLRVHSLGCAFPASRHALLQNAREKPGPSGKAGIPRSKLAGRHSNRRHIKDSDKRLFIFGQAVHEAVWTCGCHAVLSVPAFVVWGRNRSSGTPLLSLVRERVSLVLEHGTVCLTASHT
jgi:hypothetical protein